MAFINKHPSYFSTRNTKGLYIGKTEAEGENNPGQGLKEYYDDFLHIDDAICDGKFIITGRKGVGKSAYVKHLSDNSSVENEILCAVVKSNGIDHQKLIQSIPAEVTNKSSLIYEWIILTELVKLLIKNTNLQYADGYNQLKKFCEKNSGIVNIDRWQSVTETETLQLDVHFYDIMKFLPGAFGKHFDKTKCKAPFYAIIPSLKEVVIKMLSYDVIKGINHIVIFDDLDINFNLRDDKYKEDLMDLIRIARDYNTSFFPNSDEKVIITLRDDIAFQLEGIAPDKNKIFSSYEYRLNWYNSDKGSTEDYSLLRDFINKRISIGLDKIGLTYNKYDPWSSLVNDVWNDGKKNTFKYVLDCTFYRPRDLVAFFSGIGSCSYPIPIDNENIRKLIKQYVIWNASEVKDELSNLYSSKQIEDFFSIFRVIANKNSGIAYEELIKEFSSRGFSSIDFDLMNDYNLIVPKDDWDRQYFSYREQRKTDNPSQYTYRLPKCLYIYFCPYTL